MVVCAPRKGEDPVRFWIEAYGVKVMVTKQIPNLSARVRFLVAPLPCEGRAGCVWLLVACRSTPSGWSPLGHRPRARWDGWAFTPLEDWVRFPGGLLTVLRCC